MYYISRNFVVVLSVFLLCVSLTAPSIAAGKGQSKSTKTTKSKVNSGKPSAYKYVLNLQSDIKPTQKPHMAKLKFIEKYKIYKMKFKHKDKVWYRWRLGFFKSRKDANKLKKVLKPYFPAIWVDRVHPAEAKLLAAWAKPPELIKKPKKKKKKKKVKKELKIKGTIEELMEMARQAVANKKYKRAILIYSKILRSKKKHPAKQDALEFLGLAREKNGQLAHAKAAYKKYLRLYPKGEGAVRVRQRLEGIMSARTRDKRKLKKGDERDKVQWSQYGSLSQNYRRDVFSTETTDTTTQTLSTNVSYSARRRSRDYDMRSQVSASHLKNIDSDTEDDQRISTLYFNISKTGKGMSARIGRQSGSGGGVLGRFDGVLVGYRLNNKWKMNGVFGYPVTLSETTAFRTNKVFYGVSFDGGTFAKYWDVKTFLIDQTVDGISDRQAIGGEVRYNHPKYSAFSLIDYDISYGSLNTLLFNGNWRYDNATSYNLSVNYRNSPLLTTTTGLQGQTGVTTIEELLQTFTEDQIRQFAEDRTATFKSVAVSGTKRLNKKYQVNASVSVSNQSGTTTSGGVTGSAGTANSYFFSGSLIASNFFKKNDTTIFGASYSTSDTSDRISLSGNTRFKLKKKWTTRPQIRIDKTDQSSGNSTMSYRPSVRFNYRKSRNLRFDMETGYTLTNRSGTNTSSNTNFFINLGYIYTF